MPDRGGRDAEAAFGLKEQVGGVHGLGDHGCGQSLADQGREKLFLLEQLVLGLDDEDFIEVGVDIESGEEESTTQ